MVAVVEKEDKGEWKREELRVFILSCYCLNQSGTNTLIIPSLGNVHFTSINVLFMVTKFYSENSWSYLSQKILHENEAEVAK